MKHLLVALLLFSSTALAHQDQDWREDILGFLSIRYPVTSSWAFSRTQSMSKNIDMDFFKKRLAVLAGESPLKLNRKRVSLTDRRSEANLELARAFLAREYRKLGFEIRSEVFNGGTNLVAEKLGTKNPDELS